MGGTFQKLMKYKEPPNKGHFGDTAAASVLISEVGLFSEVKNVHGKGTWRSFFYREVVPFLEGPSLEVPLYIALAIV